MESVNCIHDNDGSIQKILIENKLKEKYIDFKEGTHRVNFTITIDKQENEKVIRALKTLSCKKTK